MLERRLPRVGDWLLSGMLFLGAWAVLAWAYPVSPANGDVLRDHLIARDCAELGQCRTMGANTSVPGTSFAALWVDLIATVRVLGGDVGAVRQIVLVVNALAVALICFFVRVHIRQAIALPASLLVLFALLAADMVSPFWNPSAVILPAVLCAASLLLHVLDGGTRFLLVAAFAGSLALNLHPAAATLVPPLLLIGTMSGTRPLRQALLMIAVIAVTSLPLSWLAWVNQANELHERHLLLLLVMGLVATLTMGTYLAPRFRVLGPERRALVTGVLLVAPFLLGALGMVVVLHHPASPRYLPTILAPAAVMLLLPLRHLLTPTRSIAFSAVVALWLLVGIAPRIRQAESVRYTMKDAQTITRTLVERGWTYSTALFHTQGPLCHDLTSSLGLFLPASTSAPSEAGRQIRAEFAFAGGAQRPTGTHVALEQGKSIVLEEVESWLRPWSAQVCNGQRCEKANVATSAAFSNRWNPEAHTLETTPSQLARWEIPLEPNSDATHHFQLFDIAPPGCRWRIVRVEGVSTTQLLPAEQADLTSTSGSPGKIVFEKEFDPSRCPVSVHEGAAPPCVFETRIGEAPYIVGATPG